MQCLVESDEDYSEVRFSDARIIRSRKPHKCCECRQVIARGQQYEHYSGFFEGQWFREKTCLVCVEIRSKYMCSVYEVGTIFEALYEELQARKDLDLGCLDGLSPAALDKMISLMDRAWSESEE